jgi:hypothetical protein
MAEFFIDSENRVVRMPKEKKGGPQIHKAERSRAGAC